MWDNAVAFNFTFFALYANLREDVVSLIEVELLEQLTMIEVRKLPVNESFKILVSLESLKGMCSALPLVVNALITFPKHDNE